MLSSVTETVQTVFQNTKNAVVKIRSSDKHGHSVGTGFLIDPNGTCYTTFAVAGESDNITVEMNGKEYPAKRLVADARSGIALLKIDARTAFLPMGKSHELTIATPVVTVGYPLDLPETPTLGFIAGFDLKYLNSYFTTTHIRANISVQRGESGAPLINTKSEVVGILISGLDGGSACYALPIEAAEKIRSDYVRYGEVRHGWIGITVASSPTTTAGSSAVVDTLGEQTPASDSGVQKGDTLVKIGNVVVSKPEDVLNGSYFLTAGENIPVEVVRGGEHLSFTVPAVEHPFSEKSRNSQAVTKLDFGESLSLTSGD